GDRCAAASGAAPVRPHASLHRPPHTRTGGRDLVAALAAAVRSARRAGAGGPGPRARGDKRAGRDRGRARGRAGRPLLRGRRGGAGGGDGRPRAAAAPPGRRLRRARPAARRAAHRDRHSHYRQPPVRARQGHLPRQRRRAPAGRERGRPARPRAPAVAAGDNRTVIDPLERWRQYGEKPDYAGLLTYGGALYTQDPAELAGFDVAIVGAPTDDLVSDRPGARFGPRAIRAASCPAGPHLESQVDAFEELKIVDFGDAAVLPADAVRSHEAIEALVGQVVDAGLLPVVLGGDHSIAEPDIRAVAAR